MLASSFLDPVLGIDVHFEMVPTPAPTPTPIPNPFVGVIFDPLGLAAGIAIGAAIGAVAGAPFQGPVLYWTAFPATNTGTEAKHVTGHILIPPGVAWAPFPKAPKPTIRPGETPRPALPVKPENDAVVITGSKTVSVMGSNAARLGDIALSCSEPLRLPSSVVLAIPKGAPILVGGPPSLDLMAAVTASLRTRFVSDSLHALVSRMKPSRFRNFLHRAVCFFTGHPVDVATGKVMTEQVDAALPGPLPLQIDRVYSSAFASRSTLLGRGWSSSIDQALWRERGKVVLRAEDGRELEFDTFDLPGRALAAGQSVHHPIERLTLRCLPEGRWEVEAADGVVRCFAAPEGSPVARLSRIVERTRTHAIEFHYGEGERAGQLEWIRDSAGRLLRIEHDAAGRMVALHLPLPTGEGWYAHRRYRYDAQGDLVAVEDAAGKWWRFEYATHLLTRETDRNGRSYYFAYDGVGEDAWCTRTWGDGGVFDRVLAYDKRGRITYVTDACGATTRYTMNLAGLVTEVHDAHGHATRYAYDPRTLRRTQVIDPTGATTELAYDAGGDLQRVRLPDGAALSVEYDARHDPVSARDAQGGLWQWKYDAAGRLQAALDPTGAASRWGWSGGLLAWVQSPGGRRVEFEYDEGGLVKTIREEGRGETRIERDRLGRETRIHQVGGAKVTIRYDPEGRIVELARPSGQRSRQTYDAEGHLVAAQDGARSVRLHYGPGYRLIEREEAGAVRRFEYDREGRLVAIVEPGGRRRELVRDELGRVVVDRRSDGTEVRARHDAAGRLIEHATPAGRRSAMTYDARGRLLRVDRSDGSFAAYEYRADGTLLRALNEVADVRFERDALGRVVRESVADGWVQSRYDRDGARVGVDSSRGLSQTFEWGPTGALERLWLGLPLSGEPSLVYRRDPLGREQARALPGELRVQWERDEQGRPLSRRTARLAAAGALEELRWEWEGEDQLIGMEDVRRRRVTYYDHDRRGRVVRERREDRTIERAHDPEGNVYRRADRSDRDYTREGGLERAPEVRYDYDLDGYRAAERRESGALRYEHGADGHLRAVEREGGARTTYAYDALGRRVSRLSRGTDGRVTEEVRFAWDGHRMIHEERGDGDPITWYWSPEDAAPVARRKGDALWSVVADPMGNPTEMYDARGKLAWQGRLDVYGDLEVLAGDASDCPWRFPGQYEDPETGLSYNHYRYYDPEAGQYIERDPLGLAGNSHPYGYPGNPWGWCDPLGLAKTPAYESFLQRAKDWTESAEGTPMSRKLQRSAWHSYLDAVGGAGKPVLGNFDDVARYVADNGPGLHKLSLARDMWNPFVNDEWMRGWIEKRATFLLATFPTPEALTSAKWGRSVFGREMDMLAAAGYNMRGKLGDPADPLRMEPPCH